MGRASGADLIAEEGQHAHDDQADTGEEHHVSRVVDREDAFVDGEAWIGLMDQHIPGQAAHEQERASDGNPHA